MSSTSEMKAILLEILEQAFQPADITTTQQMGVNMSSAVKRDGVVIIQNQNVEVYARIMPAMVRALRLCDLLEPSRVVIEHAPAKALPAPETSDDPIDDCCAFLYEQKIGWEDMQVLMKSRYAEFVTSKYKTKTDAAKFLGVGPTYFSKLTSLKQVKQL